MSLLNLSLHNQVVNIQNNTLDLILSNLPQYKISENKYIVVVTELTDWMVKPDQLHPPLLTRIFINRAKNEPPQSDGEVQYNYKKAVMLNKSTRILAVMTHDSSAMDLFKSVDDKTEYFYNTLGLIFKKNVPQYTPKPFKFPILWQKDTLEIYKKKERLRKNNH